MDSTKSLRCAPARRSLKFPAGDHARHFLAFDSSISKHDRMILYMELFTHINSLIYSNISSYFTPQSYLPEQYVELRVLTDPKHPAYGQIGLFAKKTIPSNTIVTPYSGFIEIFATTCSSRTYTMGFGSLGDDYALDAEFVGNYGRFANDPRGVDGLIANLSAESRFTSRGEAYTALISRRIINKGEEILMSYGKAHSLTPSPWVGLKGELLTRYRIGGIVPFPQFNRKGILHHHHNYNNNNNNNNKEQEDVEASMELLWECPQCGIWNIGSPTPVCIDRCIYCKTPRLPRAPLVAVCCTSPITEEDILASIPYNTKDEAPLLSESEKKEEENEEEEEEEPFSIGFVKANSTPASPIASPSEGGSCNNSSNNIITNNNNNNNSNNENGNVTHGSVMTFASEPVDWPLNIPFLSWQVWDAVIPLSSIEKHSKFETHENIFLYTVSTTSENDNKQPGEKRKLKNNDNGEEKEKEKKQKIEEEQPKRRGRKPKVRRTMEELWLKEEPESNEFFNHQKEKDGATDIKIENSAVNKNDNNSTDYLFFINNTTIPSNSSEITYNKVDGQQKEKEGSYDNSNSNSNSKYNKNTSALITLQNLLKGINRRVFAGKSYHRGEVVASVGGLIIPANDRRRRPDSSVLVIPMKYFIPLRVRRHLRAMLSKCNSHSKLEEENVKEDEEIIEINENNKETLIDLFKRLEGLLLVVTNELMFCPCLVLQDNDDNDNNKQDEIKKETNETIIKIKAEVNEEDRCDEKFIMSGIPAHHSLLDLCNVSFILTIDALGCPYVAVVAVRDINIFDPLLARIGS